MKRLTGAVVLPDGAILHGRVNFSARIESLEACSNSAGLYILPGLVDLQVNGDGDINVAEASSADLRRLAARLAREGVAAFLPTVITAPLAQIESADAAIFAARASQMRDGAGEAAILGMHLEGPFISRTRRGAHPDCVLAPVEEALERTLALKSLRLITLAPELDGATNAIRRFVKMGVVVSLGHSDATFEQANVGVGAGARMFTHLFNAMRPLAHRNPGIASAALLADNASAALIPDGVHVDPALLKLAIRAKGAGRIILTTDRTALAGLGATRPKGRRLRVERGAMRLEDGALAGGVISMLDGVRMMVDACAVTISEAARMASSNPAAILEVADRGGIAIGASADLIVLDSELKLRSVFVAGREL